MAREIQIVGTVLNCVCRRRIHFIVPMWKKTQLAPMATWKAVERILSASTWVVRHFMKVVNVMKVSNEYECFSSWVQTTVIIVHIIKSISNVLQKCRVKKKSWLVFSRLQVEALPDGSVEQMQSCTLIDAPGFRQAEVCVKWLSHRVYMDNGWSVWETLNNVAINYSSLDTSCQPPVALALPLV